MSRTGRLVSVDRYQTSKALLGAAVVHLIPGLLYWPVGGITFDIHDWVRIGGFAIFILMGIGARWFPLAAAVICTTLYVLLLSFLLNNIAKWNLMVWILHATILMLLSIALFAALKQRAKPTPSVE